MRGGGLAFGDYTQGAEKLHRAIDSGLVGRWVTLSYRGEDAVNRKVASALGKGLDHLFKLSEVYSVYLALASSCLSCAVRCMVRYNSQDIFNILVVIPYLITSDTRYAYLPARITRNIILPWRKACLGSYSLTIGR